MASLCVHCGAEANVPGLLHLCVGCEDSPIAKRVREILSRKLKCRGCGMEYEYNQRPYRRCCYSCGDLVG